MVEINSREDLRDKYIQAFTSLIDRAFAGERPKFLFCDDVCLELSLSENGILIWRRVYGENAD